MSYKINIETLNLDYYKKEHIEVNGIYLNVTGVNPKFELDYGEWIKIAEGLPLVGSEA